MSQLKEKIDLKEPKKDVQINQTIGCHTNPNINSGGICPICLNPACGFGMMFR